MQGAGSESAPYTVNLMTSIELIAPAKVNLFLKVLDKRKDSYHNIVTLFERVSLADTIKISKSPSGVTVSSNKTITRHPYDNIVFKAACIILKRAGIRSGVSIKIKKNIPVTSGMGGGSSDAASTLIGINKLFRAGLSAKELMGMGKTLGADVPFFLLNKPFAVGRGIGDRLNEVKSGAVLWHLIIYPGPLKSSTKDIYNTFDKVRSRLTSRDLTIKCGNDKIHRFFSQKSYPDTAYDMLHNDLETAVVSKNKVIGKILKRLAIVLDTKVILSGSGPSVFCLYDTRKEAIKAKEVLLERIPRPERKFWRIFIAKTV